MWKSAMMAPAGHLVGRIAARRAGGGTTSNPAAVCLLLRCDLGAGDALLQRGNVCVRPGRGSATNRALSGRAGDDPEGDPGMGVKDDGVRRPSRMARCLRRLRSGGEESRGWSPTMASSIIPTHSSRRRTSPPTATVAPSWRRRWAANTSASWSARKRGTETSSGQPAMMRSQYSAVEADTAHALHRGAVDGVAQLGGGVDSHFLEQPQRCLPSSWAAGRAGSTRPGSGARATRGWRWCPSGASPR